MSGAIYIVIFISCVLGAESLPQQDNFGITGGNAVNISEVPFMARYCSRGVPFCCGAAIISDTYLVTSAACYFAWRGPTFALVGTDKLVGDDGETYVIEEGYPHPRYYPNKEDAPHPVPVIVHEGYNVAVLKLAKKLTFNAKVQPIKLADTSLEMSEGAMLDTLGFGSTSSSPHDIKFLDELQKVSIPFVSQEKCRTSFWDLDKTMICAGSQYKGSNYFDEGGPLVYKNQLVGVLLYPREIGYKNFPSIYTYIPAVRDFIDAMVYREETDGGC